VVTVARLTTGNRLRALISRGCSHPTKLYLVFKPKTLACVVSLGGTVRNSAWGPTRQKPNGHVQCLFVLISFGILNVLSRRKEKRSEKNPIFPSPLDTNNLFWKYLTNRVISYPNPTAKYNGFRLSNVCSRLVSRLYSGLPDASFGKSAPIYPFSVRPVWVGYD